jgi:hypothetical protein
MAMWDYFRDRKAEIQRLREADEDARYFAIRRDNPGGVYSSDLFVKKPMNEWEVIKDSHGNSMLRLTYGDLRASVIIAKSANIFSFYEVSWDVVDYTGERGYAGREMISQYDIVRMQKFGNKPIDDAAIVKLMTPAVDRARMAMFVCVMEKLI